MKAHLLEPVRHTKGSPKGKIYSHECIYLKHGKISNKWPNAASQNSKKNKNKINPKKQKERNNKNKGPNQQNRDWKKHKESVKQTAGSFRK
jgi:hypothetical protein